MEKTGLALGLAEELRLLLRVIARTDLCKGMKSDVMKLEGESPLYKQPKLYSPPVQPEEE